MILQVCQSEKYFSVHVVLCKKLMLFLLAVIYGFYRGQNIPMFLKFLKDFLVKFVVMILQGYQSEKDFSVHVFLCKKFMSFLLVVIYGFYRGQNIPMFLKFLRIYLLRGSDLVIQQTNQCKYLSLFKKLNKRAFLLLSKFIILYPHTFLVIMNDSRFPVQFDYFQILQILIYNCNHLHKKKQIRIRCK